MKKRITDLKNSLRAEYKQRRRLLDRDEKKRRDAEICRAVMNTVSFRYAKRLLMYAPTANEVDILPIAEAALSMGKKIYFPRCNTEDNTMVFREVSELSQLVGDAYGIMAPPESADAYSISDTAAAMCLIPGLIYDRYGYRIGYGKGYYDRFLSSFGGCKAGIIYSDFIIPSIPKGHFDLKVDIMITERNVRIPLEG